MKNKLYALLLLGIVILSGSCTDMAVKDGTIIQVTFPNGGEIFLKGQVYALNWSNESNDRVSIELYMEDKYILTIQNAIHAHEYLWEVPVEIADGKDYRIRIVSLDNAGSIDESNHNFIIQNENPTSSFIDERDGQAYKTVKIGNQWWMAQNFNYKSDSGSVCYEYMEIHCERKGKLYTWQAALTNAPEGWHLPSDEEWKILEAYLGIPSNEIDQEGFRGSYEGNHLKFDRGTGFDAVYSGYCNARLGKFGHITYEARFWTSSNSNQIGNAWSRMLKKMIGGIDRHQIRKDHGLSVRYVKDEEE